ncbi:MAG: hypothetical protein APR53_00030 [Methanoculleus sp. SDB]|nr:MAG: hypothetical protein APR53_00030 [Methanoculleus sp. SDB]
MDIDIIGIVRAIVGIVLITFVPGFALSWAIFPRSDRVPLVNRLALSFVLSIIGVIATVLFIDIVLGVETTTGNIVIAVILLTVLAAVAWKVQIIFRESKLKAGIDEALRAEQNVITIDLAPLWNLFASLRGRNALINFLERKLKGGIDRAHRSADKNVATIDLSPLRNLFAYLRGRKAAQSDEKVDAESYEERITTHITGITGTKCPPRK